MINSNSINNIRNPQRYNDNNDSKNIVTATKTTMVVVTTIGVSFRIRYSAKRSSSYS